MILALAIGIPLGIVGALRQNGVLDYIATFTSIVGISTPNFVVITLLVLIFSIEFHLVPTQGWNGPFSKTVIVPAIALALGPAAFLARYTRSSMLDVIRQDYLRTARAKGLAESRVIIRHALRNALIPVTTFAGLALADVITGSFFVESIYGVPGIGRYFVSSISGRDYPHRRNGCPTRQRIDYQGGHGFLYPGEHSPGTLKVLNCGREVGRFDHRCRIGCSVELRCAPCRSRLFEDS